MLLPDIDPSNQRAVSLVEMLESAEYRAMREQSPLAIVLGQNAAGHVCVYDLSQGSHILVGGTNGVGKTNFIDACICSIISRSSPDEVKLCLIDSGSRVSTSVFHICMTPLCP